MSTAEITSIISFKSYCLTKGAVNTLCIEHLCQLGRLEGTHARVTLASIKQIVLSVWPIGTWVNTPTMHQAKQQEGYFYHCNSSIFPISAKNALHSHDMTMLIPWLMLTHIVIVQRHRLFVPETKRRAVTSRWKTQHRIEMQPMQTCKFLGIKWTNAI